MELKDMNSMLRSMRCNYQHSLRHEQQVARNLRSTGLDGIDNLNQDGKTALI